RLRVREIGRRVRTPAIGAACGLALAAALWYGAPLVVRWVTHHPYFALATVDLEGNRRLSRGEILQWIDVREGSSIWDAAPSCVRTRVVSHPWIQHASVQREFPNRLTITVHERRPVAIVRFETLNYVDRSGRVLGPLRGEDSRDFPLITGLEDGAAQSFHTLGVQRALR